MKTIVQSAGGISLVSFAMLVACGGSGNDTSMYANSGGVTSAQAADTPAVDELAAARCEREQACNNVGASSKYASMGVCLNQMRGSLANDLNAYNCPGGIDPSRLSQCTAAIRNEECGHPLDMLDRLDKCRSGSLCMKR